LKPLALVETDLVISCYSAWLFEALETTGKLQKRPATQRFSLSLFMPFLCLLRLNISEKMAALQRRRKVNSQSVFAPALRFAYCYHRPAAHAADRRGEEIPPYLRLLI
jgi:hypothetical protein